MGDGVTYVTQFTPWGDVVLAASAQGLVALRFADQGVPDRWTRASSTAQGGALAQALEWLKGFIQQPQLSSRALPPIDDSHATAFQRKVWRQLDRIPCGQTQTYAELAQQLGTSPRAVGRAVGSNPWLLMRPCHRVIGANGQLTGYAGGLARKQALLAFEGHRRLQP